MSRKLPRHTRRAKRSEFPDWSEWALVSSTEPGTCTDVRHEKELTNLVIRFKMFGPWDTAYITDCGCDFFCIPISDSRIHGQRDRWSS